MEDKINRRESELDTLRHELSQVKEYQKKKSQMQKELEEVSRKLRMTRRRIFVDFQIKEAISWNEREHKMTLDKIEQKSFEEKMRLQQESNQKVQQIAARAYEEAVKLEKPKKIEKRISLFLSTSFQKSSGNDASRL